MTNLLIKAVISNVGDVFIAFILICLSICILLFLIFRINQEKIRYSEVGKIKYILSEEDFNAFLDKKISNANKKTEFILARIDIDEIKTIKKNIGDIQFAYLNKEIYSRIYAIYGLGTKIMVKDTHEIFVFLRFESRFEDLDHIGSMIISKINEPIVFSSTFTIELNLNLAIATFPLSATSTIELFKNLELASIKSRREGLNKYQIYNDMLQNMATEEYKYYLEIKQAIEDKNFMLYYQPIVNAFTDEVVFGEALIRWDHPEKGVIMPNKFLNLMQQTGDIIWVGYWSFENLVKDFFAWQKNYPENHFKLTMNIMLKQLLAEKFDEEVKKICRRNKVLPENIVFEISCNEVLTHFDIVKEERQKLRQIGFVIAMDNYDLNLSMLENFSETHIDIVKINKKFVIKAFNDKLYMDILKIIIEKTHNENISIIVEGVEEREEVEQIKSLDIKYIQGYYFSKPKNKTEFISDVVFTPWQNYIVSDTENFNYIQKEEPQVDNLDNKSIVNDEQELNMEQNTQPLENLTQSTDELIEENNNEDKNE